MDFNRIPRDPTLMEMCRLGEDVLDSESMQSLRSFIQHGTVTRYEHCLSVCYLSLRIAERLGVKVDKRSMVRGALLHDFFMYDWHDPGNLRLLHGFTHAREALNTALEQFELNDIEQDVIRKHMFPLNIALPRYKETLIVTLADKVSAVLETINSARTLHRVRMYQRVGL